MTITYDIQNNLHIIRDYVDLQYVIEQQMGFEIGQQVQELIDEHQTSTKEFDWDYRQMEHEVEECDRICRESDTKIERLIAEIEDMKKMDRKYIIKKLEEIKFGLNNY